MGPKRRVGPKAAAAAAGTPADGGTAGAVPVDPYSGEIVSSFAMNVDAAEVHSHAKLCLEATINAPCSTPPLRGELGGLGVGFRTLLSVVPADKCTALSSVAISGGCFPPLRWEVCASRKENKPLSLAVVPGNEGGQGDCIGACFHTDWMWPSELYSDRRDFVVPLFAKLAAVYIYATEEKDIMNSEAAIEMPPMPAMAGTTSSQNTFASAMGRRRWKFTGLSYGGCVASVCCLLMPSTYVSSLVTFGSPPTFSAPDNLLPFPNTHLQHANDLGPHLFVRAAAARIAARLTGLGYLIPDPPLALPTLAGRVNKRGEPVDLYRHSAAHVMVLTPSPAQVAYGNALRKQDQQIERSGRVLGDRLPERGNTGALLVATSTLFDRRHGPVPEMVLKMLPRQQLHVMPKLESPGKIAALDIRSQTLRVGPKDYLLPIRVMLNKRIELTPNLMAEGTPQLQTFLNNNGEMATKRLAVEVFQFTSAASQMPQNANNLSSQQLALAEQIAFLGHRFISVQQQAARSSDQDGGGGGKGLASSGYGQTATDAAVAAAQQAARERARKDREFLKAKIPVDVVAQHPPLWIATQLELCSDTFAGLIGFLRHVKPAVAWEPERVAVQLAAWSGGLPVASMVANAFVQSQWLAFAVCPAPPKPALSRHVSTAAITDGMSSDLRRALSSPDGHHFEWSVAVASVTHGVGKSTLIHLLTREVVQSRFGPATELERANRPTPAKRGAPQEAVLRLKWSWAEAIEEMAAQEAAAERDVQIQLDPVYADSSNERASLEKRPSVHKGRRRSTSASPPPAGSETKGDETPAAGSPAGRRGAARQKHSKSRAAANDSPGAEAPAAAAEASKDQPQQHHKHRRKSSAARGDAPGGGDEAEAGGGGLSDAELDEALELSKEAKASILPPSVLLRLRLDEVFYDSSFSATKRLSRYAQVLWLVTDSFTADRLAASAPRLQHAFASFQQHVVIYCPRQHAAAQAGVRPSPAAAAAAATAAAAAAPTSNGNATGGGSSGRETPPDTFGVDASMPALSDAEADRIHVELVLRRLQREYHLKVVQIELMPASMASITAMNAASQHMLNLQRLMMQWMVPRLPLPVDPHTMPGGVDIGSLFTRCDDVVKDYLRTSTQCHFMGQKAQKAFTVRQAMWRKRVASLGRRRGSLGGTLASTTASAYDDVDKSTRVVAAPLVSAADDGGAEDGDTPAAAADAVAPAPGASPQTPPPL